VLDPDELVRKLAHCAVPDGVDERERVLEAHRERIGDMRERWPSEGQVQPGEGGRTRIRGRGRGHTGREEERAARGFKYGKAEDIQLDLGRGILGWL
jgi:hypothetical protein